MKSFRYAVVLTGGIATGKSTVVDILHKWGFFFIDADRVAHEILDREYREIENLFGSSYIVEKRVNRKALGRLIFAKYSEKKKLEDLLHPLIYIEIEGLAKKQDRLKKPYIIDIPLFFETNRYPIDKKIVVYTSQNKQLERLISRDKSSQKEAQQRIDAQMNIELKREKATYLIDNSSDLKALQEECVKVKEKILYDFKQGLFYA